MIIRNFYEEKLAQASYLVGCAATGEAVVIDPLRDVRPYLETAAGLGLRITAVTETHIHADFLSGSRELAAKTGAVIYVSQEGGVDWSYSFADEEGVVLLSDGEIITVGNLTLHAMHTPGHTPEHISFLLTDHATSDRPHSVFTGDFLFVGDVGRPDLLERAASIQGTMEVGARQLFQSIQGTKIFDDALLVWPGHGAGSACGKSLGGSPVTTMGYERATNWAFQVSDEDAFVQEILSGQPEPPRYFKEVKRLNKAGPTVLGSLPSVKKTQHSSGQLVDIRTVGEIRSGMVEGVLAIPAGKSFVTWAGWLLSYNDEVTLIADDQLHADAAARDMALIGLDTVNGWIHPDELLASMRPVSTITCDQIRSDDVVVDVRNAKEWDAGHVLGARHHQLGELPSSLHDLPTDRRLVVHCAAGGRSPIGVSLLRSAGFTDVVELPAGFDGIQSSCPGLVE